MVKKLELSEVLKVGHPEIDAEHGALIDQGNVLIDALERDGLEGFHEQVPIFFEMLERHFKHEISILRELGFPRVEEHAVYHDQMLRELDTLRRQLEAGAELISIDLVHARVTNLLVHDIIREDMEFKSFIIELNRASEVE